MPSPRPHTWTSHVFMTLRSKSDDRGASQNLSTFELATSSGLTLKQISAAFVEGVDVVAALNADCRTGVADEAVLRPVPGRDLTKITTPFVLHVDISPALQGTSDRHG